MVPYNARIRANVWLGNAGGTGLRIARNGQLFYGQFHLTVTMETIGSGIGIGIQGSSSNRIIGRDQAIWKNQFSTFSGNPLTVDKGGFMLITSNITTHQSTTKPLTPITKQ